MPAGRVFAMRAANLRRLRRARGARVERRAARATVPVSRREPEGRQLIDDRPATVVVPEPFREVVRNPFPGAGLIRGMDSWIGFVAFLALWIVVQRWLLPKLGVPT